MSYRLETTPMLPDNGNEGVSKTFTVLISRRRSILAISPEVFSVLGYAEDELLGRDLLDFLHVEDELPPRDVLRLSYRLPVSGIVRLRNKAGYWKPFQWRIAARVLHDTSIAYLIYAQSVPNP